MAVHIQSFFDTDTATFTYVVADMPTHTAVIIDSVLNYDQFTGRTKTDSADAVIAYLKDNHLKAEWILETHIHADHLSASRYLKEKIGGKVGIGSRIKEVLQYWVPIFNTGADTPLTTAQFDHIFTDNEIVSFGNTQIKVLHTPGHTPACASYLIEDAIFVGDTVFMPDVGTARTDFPGGSAEMLYDSIQRIFSLPDETRIFTCHDYPPSGRDPQSLSTVKEQKNRNIFINSTISKDDYITKRNARDQQLAPPRLLLPSLQVNLRAGSFGNPEDNGCQYVKIPINKL